MRKTLLAASALLLLALPAFSGGGPAETVVLVNAASPDSKKVAEYYAKKRNIPAQQVCEVKCTAGLEVPMDDFVRDVVDPLRKFLHDRKLEERCRFLVLTQGMPIRARTPSGDVSTAAALSLLDTPVCGQPQTRFPGLKHEYTAGAIATPVAKVEGKLYLVTALLSSTADEAIGLIDRSVASDGTAPAGARIVFQDSNGAANVRDSYFDGERKELEALGFATEHDKVGADAVKGREKVIGYMCGGSYSALTVDGVNSNKYLPGALCDMLQSFGAVPENFVPGGKGSQFPITHMVRAGITGVHGAVQEPYNVAFPDWQLFRPYVQGFTLAETFHQRMPYVYWMNLTLGDPLCAPYAKRPVPKIDVKGTLAGVAKIPVAAPGATRIDLYLDGRAVGSVTGAEGTAEIDVTSFASGSHELLVEATGEGAAEPRGWITASVTTHGNPAAASKPPEAPRCEKILVEAPATVTAGDTLTLKATAAGADGKPLDGWRGRLELRGTVPPVRWGKVDADGPTAELTSRLTKVGDYELRVTAPDDGREIAVKVHVDAGPFHHATCPASNFPLGQECDMDVVLEDEFGNRVKGWEGAISLEVPQDRFAVIPAPIEFAAGNEGHGVLRGVLLARAGKVPLVFKDGSGGVVSQNGEGVDVGKSPLRPWLVAGPAPGKELFGADLSGTADGDGSVAARMLLRRRCGGDVLTLPAGNAKGGEADLLVTWIESTGATKARLLAASAGRLRVFLDGKEVFDGVSKGTDPKGKREPVADLQLGEGAHRLAISVEAKGATTASFEIDDGNGQFPATLRVRARSTETPKAFVASGRVRAGTAGLPGAKIVVKGSDGKERTATSAADGLWWIEGLPAGETLVRVSAPQRTFDAAERTVTIEERNSVDIDFVAAAKK